MKSKSVMPNKSTKLPATEHTNIEINENEVLYIYIKDWRGPTMTTKKMLDAVREDFEEALPDTKIIVGIFDLHFSIITKKEVFKGRLSGKI